MVTRDVATMDVSRLEKRRPASRLSTVSVALA